MIKKRKRQRSRKMQVELVYKVQTESTITLKNWRRKNEVEHEDGVKEYKIKM